jgi:hypothetical protein
MISKAGALAVFLATLSITSSEAIDKTRPSWSRVARSPLEAGHEYPEHVLNKRQLPAEVTG